MASFCRIPLYSVVILIVSCYLSYKPRVHGAREVPNHGHVVPMESLQSASTCSSSSTGTARGSKKGVPAFYRYGPCSPLGQYNSMPNSRKILLEDQSRVDSIDANSNTHPLAETERILGAGSYHVRASFGTPQQHFSLILDTGSHFTWIQCKPCSVTCYPQDGPIFDPFASLTYSLAKCSSPGPCDYSMTYGDNSYSQGHNAKDTLSLPDPDTEVFPSFTFGCGQNNSNGFGREVAGILGLSQGSSLSFVNQTSSSFARVFCYCLTTRVGSTAYLRFGMQALKTCQTETRTYTPLVTNPKQYPKFYFVNLIGITIGDKKLAVSSMVSNSPSTILDSGTTISRLPSSVYSELRTEFIRLMSQYPTAPPLPPLMDTCYNLAGYPKDKIIPKMMLHFENDVNIDLHWSGVIWTESESQVCLGFAEKKERDHFTIIGNNQQKTLGILHNIPDRKVEFKTNAC